MAYEQFDRQYRFAAGKSGGVGFEVGTADPTALHIDFSIQKADVEAANTSKITLWNLSKAHLATLNEKDCMVTLKAGYGSQMPLIFVGAITHIETVPDSADRMTEIEAIDGRIELRDTYVSLSYNGNISAKTVLQDTARQMGVTITFSYNADFGFLYSYAYIGAAKGALDKACALTGLMWEIQNGILQIKRRGDTMSREVFVLSADSGLIGIPKKLTEGAQNEADQNKQGWEVTFFLNGAIGVGDYIKIESKIVTGFYRVHSIDLNGDNEEGDWLCTAKVYELAPVVSDTQYPASSAATADFVGELKSGDKVTIKPGSKWYGGQSIPDWVMSDTWIVLQVKGDRAVLNKNVSGSNAIMSPINVSNLIKA
jgi:hypothetical protein